MDKPIINRRIGGEYSTITLPGGTIETVWFGSDGEQRMIGRYYPLSAREVAAMHIDQDRV